MKYVICILFSFLVVSLSAQGNVTLADIHKAVLGESYAATSSQNKLKIAELDFSLYKSGLKPFIGVQADIPNYSKTSAPVTQPDGTIAFQSIRQSNGYVGAFVNQPLTSTGGTVYLNTGLSRFDDYSKDFTQFNGIPVRVGIIQPIFGYNRWKYDKDIEPLRLQEAKRTYELESEQALLTATQLYFDILIAEENLKIANVNLKANEKLVTIADERLTLGKISKDEKLQLDMELNQSQLSTSQAQFQKESAIQALYTYLGSPVPSMIGSFDVPAVMDDLSVDVAKLTSSAIAYRPETVAFQREMRSADSEMARSKAEFGPQITVSASYGLARGADNVSDVYADPFSEQQANVNVSIPILDWGRKKSAVQQAKIRKMEAEANYTQTRLVMENDIKQRAMRMQQLQKEVGILNDIMKRAQERYNISNERYILGDMSITNLTIAQREKDQAQRNYINGLRNYWLTYHQLRTLTGIDIFEN